MSKLFKTSKSLFIGLPSKVYNPTDTGFAQNYWIGLDGTKRVKRSVVPPKDTKSWIDAGWVIVD